MVVSAGSLEDGGTLYFGDIADRPFGSSTSRGYADNVPSYFRRGESEISNRNLNSVPNSSQIDRIPLNARIPRMEQLLSGLNSLVDGYNPFSKGKALIFKAEFLDRQNRIEELLTHMSMVPEVLSHYRSRYEQLVNCAKEKCNRQNKK